MSEICGHQCSKLRQGVCVACQPKKTTGNSLDEHGEHWKVNCPKCDKEFEYKVLFDPTEIENCSCGCSFQTTKIYFENDDYLN